MSEKPLPQDTVTAYLSAKPKEEEINPGAAYKHVLKDGLGILEGLDKSCIKSHKWEELDAIDDPKWFDKIASKGRFPYRPSDLFLKAGFKKKFS